MGMIVLAVPCTSAGATDLQTIIAAYGGRAALERTVGHYFLQQTCNLRENAKSWPESRRCWLSKSYRRDGWTARIETEFQGHTTVVIVRKDSGTTFVDGPWFEQLLAGRAASAGQPMTAQQLDAYHASLQVGIYSILLQAQSLGAALVDGMTRDGKSADVLRMNIEGKVHEYLFDPQSHLCLEMRSGPSFPNGVASVLTDYRTIDGVPVPFQTDVYHGANTTPGERTIPREIKFGQTFPDELFQPPQRLPLWFWPTVILGAIMFAAIFVFLLIGQRTRALRDEAAEAGTIAQR